jgi:hypothetical protein
MGPEQLPWGDELGLLVADVSWALLQGALRDLAVEVEVGAAVADWGTWDGNWSGPGMPVLVGELDGRAYLYDRSPVVAGAPDLIAELAARTGGLVLGHAYQDTVGMEITTVARGPELLRYVWTAGAPYEHTEGAPLPGETPEASIESIEGLRRVLAALGFVVEGPDGWLARGAKWDAQWIDPDSDAQPEAHARLHFGPLRARTIAVERASCEATFGPEAAAAYDELVERLSSPDPSAPPSDERRR